jgi:adenylate cyclase
MLRLSLFGGFSAAGTDGAKISLKSQKAKALLAYLALPPGKSRSREEIMALLWSERGDAQARASLRQALTGLRKDLDAQAMTALNITDDAVSLDPDKVTVAAAGAGEELLAGFHLHDPAFEDWLRDERLRLEDTAAPSGRLAGPSLPDKPSIAVLPFTDMSGGPAQDHFAECIAEDINTALSKIPTLFVIDRTSTSVYRHNAVDVKQVGQEQGVRYVLKGSVQRNTNRVRVSVQLVDTTSGQHVWAQRFDRVIQDVFALQDEITHQVILALQIKLTDGERARILARGTENLEAWQLAIQASHYFNSHERQSVLEGRRLIDEALRLDEHYASAHTLLGWAHWMDAYDGWSEDFNKSIELTVKAARHSLALEPNNPETYALLAMSYILARDYDQAWAQIEKATTLGPGNSKVLALTALVALWCERPEQAESLIRQAMRLCPIYPAWYPTSLAEIYFVLGQTDEAIEVAQAVAESDPDYIHAHITLAVAYAAARRIEEARAAAAEVRRIEPDFSVGIYARAQPYRDEQELARIVEGLRAAGLPD